MKLKKSNTIEIKAKSGTNVILQKAIDTLSSQGGGKLLISDGTFYMFDSLHLRSNVSIIGSKKTVLKKAKCVYSKLSADLGYGHYDVSVEKPELFKKGMGIYIFDDFGKGFYGTVATITWKDGDKLGIDRMLNHDYARIRNAMVCSVFPIVSGYYVKNAVIKGIMIDGNADENLFIDGCRGGGIFLLQCHNIDIENVFISNYNGDGLSFQQCTNLKISNCEINNNRGSGLHPGSGSAGVVMSKCKITNNGKDGVFYCLRVTYTLLENCEIMGNGNDGISIGARDTDHIIRNNIISNNYRYGIYFRPADRVMGGHRNLIDSNIIKDNCKNQGDSEVFIEDITDDIWLKKNQISGENSKYAIIVGEYCERIVVDRDNVFGQFKKGAYPENSTSIVLKKVPQNLKLGPDYLNLKAVRHLNIKNP